MSMSVPYQIALKEAEFISKLVPLEAFNYSVHVITEEGGTFWFQNAFLTEIDVEGIPWIAIIPEHEPIHVYAENDIYGVQMYKALPPLKVLE